MLQMHNRIVELVRSVARLLGNWPRRHVLRATGEPVELLEVRDDGIVRRLLVELRGGRRIEVVEDELTSVLAFNAVTAGACIAVALAGLAAGGTLGLERGERLLADVAACARAVNDLEAQGRTP
jgi:hypothetical protein